MALHLYRRNRNYKVPASVITARITKRGPWLTFYQRRVASDEVSRIFSWESFKETRGKGASQREIEIGYQKDNYASWSKSSNFSTSLPFLAFMSFSVSLPPFSLNIFQISNFKLKSWLSFSNTLPLLSYEILSRYFQKNSPHSTKFLSHRNEPHSKFTNSANSPYLLWRDLSTRFFTLSSFGTCTSVDEIARGKEQNVNDAACESRNRKLRRILAGFRSINAVWAAYSFLAYASVYRKI